MLRYSNEKVPNDYFGSYERSLYFLNLSDYFVSFAFFDTCAFYFGPSC